MIDFSQISVWPTMITPFTQDNKIDYNSILKILKWYDQQGVEGVFAVCQSSEMFLLSREERNEIAKFIVKNKPKYMRVVTSGHVESTLSQQVDEAKRMIDTGVDAYVLISNNLGQKEDEEAILQNHLEQFISQVEDIPLGLYECPYPYKRLVPNTLLEWCSNTGRFSFLKDTCCDLDKMRERIEIVRGSNLKLYNANAATLLESLKLGYTGYSGVMTNFHARFYIWLCQNFKNHPETALLLQDYLGLASVIECQSYPVNAKYHMQLEGINMNLKCRVKDERILTKSGKREVEQLKEMGEWIERSLNIKG